MTKQSTFFQSLNEIPAFVFICNAAGPIKTLSDAHHVVSKGNLNEYSYHE